MRRLLSILGLLLHFSIWSQCAFDNTFLSNVTLNCPGSVTVPCIYAGQYVTMDVEPGNLYTFSTCGSSSFDTQITIYNSAGTEVKGYNDDACGWQSMVTMSVGDNCLAETIHVLVDQYNCNNNSSSCVALEVSCQQSQTVSSSNLPIVVINTAGCAAIPNEPKVDATMGIIYNGEGQINNISDPFNEYDGNIGIELRGSSSQMFPKKQYGIETRDNFGQSHDVTMFNMAYDNDWVLYAPYSDKSLIRNVLAYQFGWDLGQYAPRTKLCELVLNGQYEGVYVLTEKIKRKDGKVGFDDVEPNENSGNELTGDYILKVDKFTSNGVLAWTSPYPPYAGSTDYHKFQLHDPPWDSLTSIQKNYIENHITNFETALYGPNFADPVIGYAPYIDIQSFVNFFLVNELTKNIDGYRISSFLHKIRTSDGGKIYAGPLWDFNLAMGNANYCDGENPSGWELDFYQFCGGGLQNPFWWKKLLQDPKYAHDANCTWQEMRAGPWQTDSLLQKVDDLATYLNDAQQRNFQRWPILGQYVWPNFFIGNSYQEEINYLKQWIVDRVNWMDANMFGSCADLGLYSSKIDVIEVYPNPATSYVQIAFGDYLENAVIELHDISGKTVIERIVTNTKAVVLPLNYRSGIYYLKVHDGSNSSIHKLIIED